MCEFFLHACCFSECFYMLSSWIQHSCQPPELKNRDNPMKKWNLGVKSRGLLQSLQVYAFARIFTVFQGLI